MKILAIDYENDAVVVLGAGATRGASFVKDRTGALPPLDSDFFTQAQRLSSAKPVELVERLIENTVSIFGTNFALTMEDFLTHVEHLTNIFNDYRLQGRPRNNPYPRMREQFLQVLAAVLDETLGREPDCDFHRALVRSLAARDTIVSFNYDWLIDQTLKVHGRAKWNPRSACGIQAYVAGDQGQGTRYWACRDPRTDAEVFPSRTVTLLKMHGSMNWFPVPSDQAPPATQIAPTVVASAG